MTDSPTLLAEYAKTRSEAAFKELVQRYIDLVYSTSVRLMNADIHRAQDITQIVFADLARLAPTIPDGVMLGGWLHRRACHVAATILRGERRRQSRERQAAEMNAQPDHSEANFARIAPLLDDAINALNNSDRAAIVLRFFESQDFRAIGSALGSNEDAAQKRVSRALEKLHTLLKRRGVVLTVGALGVALAGQPINAAPSGLALAISTSALTTAAASGGTALTLIHYLAMTKTKIALGALLVAGLVTPLVIQHRSIAALREENDAIRQQAGQSSQLAAQNQQLSNDLAAAKASARLNDQQLAELARLRRETDPHRAQERGSSQTRAPSNAATSSSPAGNNAAPFGSIDAPTVPLLPSSQWTNVGNATPEAEWQTVSWALLKNDTNTITQSVAWEADVKAKAETIFNASSPAAQKQFGTVDGAFDALLTTMTHGRNMTAFGIASQNANDDDDANLVVQEQQIDGNYAQFPVQMHRFDNGWRVMVPPGMMDSFGSFLNTPALWPPQ